MPILDNLISKKIPPRNRVSQTDEEKEKHFTEAAIMLAFAFNLFERYHNLKQIEIHPDGEHGKQFEIKKWLEENGFKLVQPQGKTKYGGLYLNDSKSILVSLKPGVGDLVAQLEDKRIIAECKGGIMNTKHPGQKSRLRRGLCEVIGLLMARDQMNEIQFAVVPFTDETKRLSERMKTRCIKAGIEIQLVREDGTIN